MVGVGFSVVFKSVLDGSGKLGGCCVAALVTGGVLQNKQVRLFERPACGSTSAQNT